MLVAFPLLAVTLTTSPVLIAGVAVAGRLPWLLVSLPAGALADRMSRRRLVAIVEVARAIVMLGLGVVIVTDRVSLAALYLSAFLVGVFETAFSAATRAAVPSLVSDAGLPRANGYLLASETSGKQFAGPAVGGLLFAASPALPFLGDAMSFAGSAVLLNRALPRTAAPSPAPSTTLAGDVREGLAWFRRQRLLRLIAFTVTTLAFCQSAVLSILVLYGLQVLGLSDAGYGLFLAVGATGDVLGSLLAHRAHARLGPGRAILAASVAAATGYLILAATDNVVVAVVGFALEAVAVALGNVATLTLRHQIVPTELFGRVNNAFRMCVFGVMPLGALAGGLTAARLGVQETLVAAAVLQLSVTALIARRVTAEFARSRLPGPDHDDQGSPPAAPRT